MAEKRKTESEGVEIETKTRKGLTVLYGVEDNPPWPLSFFLGFQHYLTAFGSTLTVPLVLAAPLCMQGDQVGLSELIATMFFMSGIATLLQTTFGIRLPIIQGATFAFLPPTKAILDLPKFACPANVTVSVNDLFQGHQVNITSIDVREEWQLRLREIQGAVCVASIFQLLIGMSGVVAFLLRYIGPLTIVPTITLIGLSLFEVAASKAATHWWIALMTLALIALFCQYLKRVKLPLLCSYGKTKGCHVNRLPIFELFPILLAMLLSWFVCFLLTTTNVLPSTPGRWGYEARTDVRASVVWESSWVRVPYPFQWGIPTVSVGAVFGMLAGVLASMMESMGDYYACARLAGAPPPPSSAVNRGIAIEGLSCIIAGLIGTGNGTTSYSENVGAIGITRVGSRRVVFCTAILLIVLGCFGKVGALFVTIPDPVVGGMFIAMFGTITAVGLSNLQFVDLRSTRNIFILAFSLFGGFCFPYWLAKNRNVIDTGNQTVNQIVVVLLSTSMFVGGVIGFVLDITIPGTLEERGIVKWRQEQVIVTADDASDQDVENKSSVKNSTAFSNGLESSDNRPSSVYDLPWKLKSLNKIWWTRYIPFCPASDFETNIVCRKKAQQETLNVQEQINDSELDENFV